MHIVTYSLIGGGRGEDPHSAVRDEVERVVPVLAVLDPGDVIEGDGAHPLLAFLRLVIPELFVLVQHKVPPLPRLVSVLPDVQEPRMLVRRGKARFVVLLSRQRAHRGNRLRALLAAERRGVVPRHLCLLRFAMVCHATTSSFHIPTLTLMRAQIVKMMLQCILVVSLLNCKECDANCGSKHGGSRKLKLLPQRTVPILTVCAWILARCVGAEAVRSEEAENLQEEVQILCRMMVEKYQSRPWHQLRPSPFCKDAKNEKDMAICERMVEDMLMGHCLADEDLRRNAHELLIAAKELEKLEKTAMLVPRKIKRTGASMEKPEKMIYDT